MAVSISGYASYIPKCRIKRDEYTKAWGSFSAAGVNEKSVMGFDEDVLTFAAKVSKRALESASLGPEKVSRLALASTTAPYIEKLLSGTVLVSGGMPSQTFSTDHTTSTRAGTEAFLAAVEHMLANPAGNALIVAADAPTASMWDPIEHPLGAGAAAFVLSNENPIAEIEGWASHASEYFGERFKRRGEGNIQDLSVRKFEEGSLLANTMGAGKALLKKLDRKPGEYQHVVIQQPDARVPTTVASRMSFSDAQLSAGLISKFLGDLGAASTLVALAAVLDVAKVGDRIMVISYGSGAGSDAISLSVVSDRKSPFKVQSETDAKEYIDYIKYLKLKGAIV